MKRRIATAAVLLCTLSATPAASADDMAGHWAAAEVLAAREAGLVNGFPDGTYRPDKSVTRAEFIKLMVRVRGLPPVAGTGGFTDLAGHWLAEQGYIQAAADAGLVQTSDYGDSPELEADQPINRVEAAVLMARTANRLGAAQTLLKATLPFTDPVPEWATGFVAAVNATGIFKGNGDGTFGAEAYLTRAQAAAIALRALEARKAATVPVWEANSWQVSTLPHRARQVTASWDGTLYWFGLNPGELYRMAPSKEPELLATLDFAYDTPIAAGPDAVYVAQGFKVLRITPDGQVSTWAGGDEAGYRNGAGSDARFGNIYGMCTGPDGHLYVTEDGRVRGVDTRGRVSTVAGLTPRQEYVLTYGTTGDVAVNLSESPEGPAYLVRMAPAGCAVDAAGNLYVADHSGSIQQMTPDGWVSWYAGGAGLGDGAVAEAGFGPVKAMTAADPWGNIWLLDSYERVRRITPDGHVYTVAGGGGTATMFEIKIKGTRYPGWVPAGQTADGPGPDARLGAPMSIALAGGVLYVTDGNQGLRAITGSTDWYPGEKNVVLHPQMDNPGFFAEGGGRYRPEQVRLPVALYTPAEGVGLLAGSERVAETHHPLYTLEWPATAGRHVLTPSVRLPDGRWVDGAPREVEVAADGWSTGHAALVVPRDGSWLRGTVELKALSYGKEAELMVDGQTVVRGTGLITAKWDTTQVADGIHEVTLVVNGNSLTGKRVRVSNGPLPPPEPEGDGYVLFLGDRRHIYSGRVPPQLLEGVPVVPFHETAAALDYKTAWDPDARLLTVTGGTVLVTLHVDTGEAQGLSAPLTVKVAQRGDEFLVDWGFFMTLTGRAGLFDKSNQFIVLQ